MSLELQMEQILTHESLDYALHGLLKTGCCQKNFLLVSALRMFSRHVFKLLVPSLRNTTC